MDFRGLDSVGRLDSRGGVPESIIIIINNIIIMIIIIMIMISSSSNNSSILGDFLESQTQRFLVSNSGV